MLLFILGILLVAIFAGVMAWLSPWLTSVLGSEGAEALQGSLLILSPLILIVLGFIIIGLSPFLDSLWNREWKKKKK